MFSRLRLGRTDTCGGFERAAGITHLLPNMLGPTRGGGRWRARAGL